MSTGFGPKKKLNVLLIEDDPEFAHSLEIRLTKQSQPSLSVVCETNLERGMLALQSQTFHLILLDLTLPDSDGIESYMRLQSNAEDTPIVILTGHTDDQLALEAVKKGAEDFLLKGEVDGRMIARVIRYAIERHKIRTELALVTRELRETNLRLERMTILDPLTELYNRRGLQRFLSREMDWASRHGWNLLVMILDVDQFKQINDTFGYAVGDVLLREIASVLKKAVRLTDHIARIGGDEFIVLLPETPFEEGVRIAERMRLAISDTTFLLSDQEKIKVTASGGFMMMPKDTVAIDELLARIHPLLKKSKKEGGDCLSWEEHPVLPAGNSRDAHSDHLKLLHERRNFIALKQPIIRLSDQALMGYEFLSRMKTGPLKMPNDFLRVALENNMLTLVDHHCFLACVEAATKMPVEMIRHVNIFPSTLIDVPVDDLIKSLPKEIPTKNFCFEISEQQVMGDPRYLTQSIKQLRDAGIQIAIDDVGFGQSCLESLIAFEPDIIKLDRKYVDQVSRDPTRFRSLERILKIANGLDSEVIAEGIESVEDLEVLKKAGVQYGQGYLLGRPA